MHTMSVFLRQGTVLPDGRVIMRPSMSGQWTNITTEIRPRKVKRANACLHGVGFHRVCKGYVRSLPCKEFWSLNMQ